MPLDPADTVRSFIQAWNTDDDDERLRLLRSICTPDARFSDPTAFHPNPASLSAAIGAFRRAFPRATVAAGPPDAHHDSLRFRWETHWNDGREPLYGDDIATLDADGRIMRLVSFNGSPQSPA